jgi:hypothetical protein
VILISSTNAIETLELLWQNYRDLAKKIDPEAMDSDILAVHVKQNSKIRPFRIATWLSRQAYFIGAWSLWEYYTNEFCDCLLNEVKKEKHDSHVDWVKKKLELNGIDFSDYQWFSDANGLRNIFAHYGGRVIKPRSKKLFHRASKAFSKIETHKDHYVAIDHCHLAVLQIKIEDFINEMSDHLDCFKKTKPNFES